MLSEIKRALHEWHRYSEAILALTLLKIFRTIRMQGCYVEF